MKDEQITEGSAGRAQKSFKKTKVILPNLDEREKHLRRKQMPMGPIDSEIDESPSSVPNVPPTDPIE